MADLISMLAAAAGASAEAGEYQISRSLRFNSADSAYLSRTPASAGNRKTWTWSGWVKRSGLGTLSFLFSGALGTAGSTAIRFETDNTLNFYDFNSPVGAYRARLNTSQVFRDVGSWYHIVAVFDTGSATTTLTGSATDRVRLYVNGVQVSNFSATVVPSLNHEGLVNTTNPHAFNARYSTSYIDIGGNFYLADVHFVDGAALTADSFGEFNADTGVWSPIAYAGTYGTNGFHLEFADNSDVTASTLGKDTSGNGNNWTPSGSPGFSVTAGAGNDSLVDSPTRYGTDTGAGGEVRGNYCTLNPLNNTTTLSNGNLQSVSTGDDWYPTVATFGMSSGKWYWEIVMTAQTAYIMIGIVPPTFRAAVSTYPGVVTGTGIGYFNDDGDIFTNGNGSRVSYGAGYTVNDVIGVALDMDAGTLTFYKNGVSQGTAATGLTGTYLPAFGNYRVTAVANFGQRPFAYTAPSGFKALCTTNLPDPTVVQGDDYFNTVLWTGNSASRSITGVGFQPDFVWIKNRSAAYNHRLADAVRGAGKELVSNSTGVESTNDATGYVSSFDSDGFSLTDGAGVNNSGNLFVGWSWKANGAGSSNTAGTISSTVSANTTAGISIVTYTGNGSNSTVGHGLGVAPKLVIVKCRSADAAWVVWEQTIFNASSSNVLYLNTTNAQTSASTNFNSTAPTSTVFSVGTSGLTNTNTATYVAYCFAEVEGFSKFGSYTGNGSADGPFVYTGFRPAFLLIKVTSTTANWFIYDSVRDSYNAATKILQPSGNFAEATDPTYAYDLVSNGFKLRNSNASFNGSGGTYIYAAFASNPFKTSLAR